MQPLESELRVIEAAATRARTLRGDPNHTVAAVALDTVGRMHAGVNVHHFTGGPCAELVALGAAAAAHAGPLVAMAAVGDSDRGVVAPCGRCRQAMLDLHPDMLVAVPADAGVRMRPIAQLLPDAYRFPDAEAPRVLRFNKRYYEAIATGRKTSTVRWNERVPSGRAVLYFEDDDRPPLQGEVIAVRSYRVDELTQARLRLSDGESVEGHIRGIRAHYPSLPPDARVDVVDFALR